MKKLVKGLIGIVLGVSLFSFSGCERSFQEEVRLIKKSSATITDIIKAEPNDFYQVYYVGDEVHVSIVTKDEVKVIVYRDSNKDGRYDKKEIFTIPKNPSIQVIPPDSNSRKEDIYKEKPRRKIPEGEKGVYI